MSSGWRGMLWPSRGAIAVKMDDGGTPPGSNHSLCPPALVHPARPPRSSIKYGWGPSVPTSQLNHLNLVPTHTQKNSAKLSSPERSVHFGECGLTVCQSQTDEPKGFWEERRDRNPQKHRQHFSPFFEFSIANILPEKRHLLF